MKTTKPAAILLALVLLIAAAAKPAEAMVKPKISNTRTASCLVKITSDPAVLPLSDIVIKYLLHSSGVAGKAARDVLDISPDDAFQLFTIEDVAKYSAGLPRSSSRTTTTAVRAPSPARIPAFPAASIMPGKIVPKPKPTPSRTVRRGYSEEGISKITAAARRAAAARTPARTAAATPRPTTTSSRRPTTRTRPTTPAASPTSAAEETILFKLQVNLSEELDGKPIKPAAEEFMGALINNLRETLTNAYENHEGQLQDLLEFAEEHHGQAELELKLSQNPADVAVYRQLEEIVDLSQLTPEMALSEAIEELKNAVEPPLTIIVIWRDLYDKANIEQTTPINMDGLPAIPLGTALKHLLHCASSGTELAYEIEEGVITIATRQSLPTSRETLLQSTQLPVEMTLEKKQNLLREKQNLEMQVAALAARSSAIEQQVANISKQVAAKLVEADPITVEFQKIVKIHEERIRFRIKGVPELETAENLARARIELAQHREQVAKFAGGDQLARFNDELTTLTIDLAEKTAMLSIVSDQLGQTEKELTAAATFDPQVAQIRFAKVALELANQRINELKTRLANLQPPTVTVLGGS